MFRLRCERDYEEIGIHSISDFMWLCEWVGCGLLWLMEVWFVIAAPGLDAFKVDGVFPGQRRVLPSPAQEIDGSCSWCCPARCAPARALRTSRRRCWLIAIASLVKLPRATKSPYFCIWAPGTKRAACNEHTQPQHEIQGHPTRSGGNRLQEYEVPHHWQTHGLYHPELHHGAQATQLSGRGPSVWAHLQGVRAGERGHPRHGPGFRRRHVTTSGGKLLIYNKTFNANKSMLPCEQNSLIVISQLERLGESGLPLALERLWLRTFQRDGGSFAVVVPRLTYAVEINKQIVLPESWVLRLLGCERCKWQ